MPCARFSHFGNCTQPHLVAVLSVTGPGCSCRRAPNYVGMEAAKPHLSGLGKCALFASFIFAAAIWWVVAESNTSAMEYRTPLIKPEAATHTTYAQAHAAAARAHTGGDRLRGTSPDARRSARSRNGTRQQLGGAGRRETVERELDLKSREIQEAQKDPNSMFDMSNP